MYKYLVILANESIDYESKTVDDLFKDKTLIVEPITLIVEAFDAYEAENEAYNILENRVEFKKTLFNEKSLTRINTIINSYEKYYTQAVVKLEY